MSNEQIKAIRAGIDDTPLSDWDTSTLLCVIEAAQNIQKRNPPASAEWTAASVVINTLAPLMAERCPRAA